MSTHDMILLIDAGNTRIKFGRLLAGNRQRDAVAAAFPHDELGRLPAWLATLPSRPAAALGVNVAGAAIARRIGSALNEHCGLTVQWVSSGASAAGILNQYDDPTQLGADRWVSLIGMAGHTPDAAILATFGTATTVDTLGPLPAVQAGTESQASIRRFEGGLILPGPELMRRSLATGTAGLPYAQGPSVPHPRNTHAAISSGIAAAQAGAVLRQWRAALQALNTAPQLYCTGGGWPLVCEEVAAGLARCQADMGLPDAPPRFLEAPVLDGLAALATAAGTQ